MTRVAGTSEGSPLSLLWSLFRGKYPVPAQVLGAGSLSLFLALTGCPTSPPLNATSITCSPGRTVLDGVCVREEVADYVACVRAQGASLGGTRSEKLSADVGAMGMRAGAAADVSESLQKQYSISDQAVLEIVRSCGGGNLLASKPSAQTTPSTGPGAPAERISSSWVMIIPSSSSKCLDVTDRSVANGALIQQWDCALGAPNQVFRLDPVGQGWYMIVGRQSGRCLDVKDRGVDNGALIQQWECVPGVPNQLFKLVESDKGTYSIVPKNSNRCLDVKDRSLSNGGQIQQWECVGAANQRFRLDRVQ